MRRYITTSTVLLTALLAFLVWASVFQIDQTVRARGKVVVQGRVQVVQSPDGGVLSALHVQEGDFVRAGQLLAEMNPEAARAAVDEITAEIETNEMARIRVEAELSGEAPDFNAFAASYPQVAAAQLALWHGNMAALEAEVQVAQQQLNLAQTQFENLETLAASGDISRAEVARAQREVIQIQGAITGIREKYRGAARKDIAAIEQQISTLDFRLAGRQNSLGFTNLVAPEDGVVTQLRTNTLGAVLRAGDELMRISPSEGARLAEVQIAPMDIGSLSAGQPVTVQLDAFSSTIYGSLEGSLDYVSADTITENAGDGRSHSFYLARIGFLPTQTNPRIALGDIKPGMELTVDVKTGRRSIMTYLAKPILRAFSGALKER